MAVQKILKIVRVGQVIATYLQADTVLLPSVDVQKLRHVLSMTEVLQIPLIVLVVQTNVMHLLVENA